MKRKRRKASAQEEESTTSFLGKKSSPSRKSNDKEQSPASLNASKRPDTGKKRSNKMVASVNVEDTLRESQAIAQALMNASQDALTVLDSDGTILEANVMVSDGFAIPRHSLIGSPAWDLFPAHVATRRKAALQEACQTSNVVRFEDERDGRYFDHVIYPIVESDRSINKFVVIARDITKRKLTEKALGETEERYRLVVERTSDLVSITTFSGQPSYVYVNPSYHVILGYKPEELIGKCPFDFMHPEDRERHGPVLRRYLDAKSQGLLIRGGKGATERMLYRLKDAWGNWRYLEGTADLMGEEHILMVSRDVSMRIKTDQDLEKERKELEGKVEERTKELKMKTERLEETNTALKVLLEMRERDRKELEQSVLFNVSQLAGPYLEKLKNSGLDEKQKGYLNILGSSLEEIVLPLSRDLLVSETNLTPSEVRIANLIKLGKSSKEIAESLNLSIKTIETHRRNIRTKLGIEKKKTNLRSYLLNRPNP